MDVMKTKKKKWTEHDITLLFVCYFSSTVVLNRFFYLPIGCINKVNL